MRLGARLSGVLLSVFPLWSFESEQCAVCHPKEAAVYRQSGMARSFRVATEWPTAKFGHPPSRSRVTIRGRTHEVRSDSGATVTHDAAYSVGSGNVGSSFLIEVAGRLFQSPASYYTNRKAWGVSPGYERDRILDFSRPVTEECLVCHAGSAQFVTGSMNRYGSPPAPLDGISCESCHGSGEAHAAKPSRENIVQPARLAVQRRDAVCEQCHLAGETRILQPGKSWQDFRPGASLESAWTVFVREGDPSFKVASHSEQLANSMCAIQSGDRMWCGTCHRVHAEKADYKSACLSCHRPALAKDHTKKAECVSCHMPKLPAADGGHTPFTDHRILRTLPKSRMEDRFPAELRPWREGPNPARNLGLAYVHAGHKVRNEALIQRGFRILAERQADYLKDAAVMAALGQVLHEKGRPNPAASLLQRAVTIEPKNVIYRLNLGLAQAAAGQTAAARQTLQEVLRLDDSVAAAREALDRLSN